MGFLWIHILNGFQVHLHNTFIYVCYLLHSKLLSNTSALAVQYVSLYVCCLLHLGDEENPRTQATGT